jgi:hypothetical protein
MLVRPMTPTLGTLLGCCAAHTRTQVELLTGKATIPIDE